MDSWFDQEKAKSVLFDILHSFSSTNEFTLKATLDLKGTPSGTHFLKAEIYEFMFSKKKQSHTEKEIKKEYTPQTKITNLREIPIVRKIEGEGIVVISENEKQTYHEMKETRRKELASKREE